MSRKKEVDKKKAAYAKAVKKLNQDRKAQARPSKNHPVRVPTTSLHYVVTPEMIARIRNNLFAKPVWGQTPISIRPAGLPEPPAHSSLPPLAPLSPYIPVPAVKPFSNVNPIPNLPVSSAPHGPLFIPPPEIHGAGMGGSLISGGRTPSLFYDFPELNWRNWYDFSLEALAFFPPGYHLP
jgi:hypothetical protein